MLIKKKKMGLRGRGMGQGAGGKKWPKQCMHILINE
jgi:hypothetical protein